MKLATCKLMIMHKAFVYSVVCCSELWCLRGDMVLRDMYIYVVIFL